MFHIFIIGLLFLAEGVFACLDEGPPCEYATYGYRRMATKKPTLGIKVTNAQAQPEIVYHSYQETFQRLEMLSECLRKKVSEEPPAPCIRVW